MSIWSSIGIGEPAIVGLDGDDEAANYRAEGEPTIDVGVATTGWHDHLRLSLNTDDWHIDVDVLLSVEQAKRLIDHLSQAVDICERNRAR